jgi:hypothetical protein
VRQQEKRKKDLILLEQICGAQFYDNCDPFSRLEKLVLQDEGGHKNQLRVVQWKKQVIMRGRWERVQDEMEVGMGEREFMLFWDSELTLASFDSMYAQWGSYAYFTDFWDKRLKLPANAWQVWVCRSQVDVARYVDGMEAEGVWCGIDRETIHVTKGQIWIKGRCVCSEGGWIKRKA